MHPQRVSAQIVPAQTGTCVHLVEIKSKLTPAPTSSPEGLEAAAYWAAHPISDAEPQMSDWNGGVGSKQMK